MSFANQLTTPQGILDLFNEYSVEPSDGDLGGATRAQVGGGLMQDIDAVSQRAVHHDLINSGRGFVELRKSTDATKLNKKLTAIADAYRAELGRDFIETDLAELTRRQAPVQRDHALTSSVRGRQTLKTIFHATANAGTTAPCYFLPWNPQGGAVELRIPQSNGGPPSAQDPILFLTAALSGCSIYVEGPAEHPRIFHCGTQFTAPGRDSASQFWDDVIRQLNLDPATMATAHSRDYTIPNRETKANLKMATRRDTETTKQIQKLSDQAGVLVKVEKVASWGAVFGIRTGNKWAFYLQENCSVTYMTVRKSSVLKRRIAEGDSKCYSRPVVCRQIFPIGGAKAEVFERYRQLKV